MAQIRDIKRQDVKDVVSDYKQGLFGGRPAAKNNPQYQNNIIYGVPSGAQGTLAIGTPVSVYSFHGDNNINAVYNRWLNKSLCFNFTAVSESARSENIATLEAAYVANNGGVAQAKCCGYFGAFVQGINNEDGSPSISPYVTNNFVQTNDSSKGKFYVVACSDVGADGKYFCALALRTVSDIVAVEPLIGRYSNDGVYEIRSGVYFSNKNGEPIPNVEASGALPNSCHVTAGDGIFFDNGGSCGHGAEDGFILEIRLSDEALGKIGLNNPTGDPSVINVASPFLSKDASNTISWEGFYGYGTTLVKGLTAGDGISLENGADDRVVISVDPSIRGIYKGNEPYISIMENLGGGGEDWWNKYYIQWNGVSIVPSGDNPPFLAKILSGDNFISLAGNGNSTALISWDGFIITSNGNNNPGCKAIKGSDHIAVTGFDNNGTRTAEIKWIGFSTENGLATELRGSDTIVVERTAENGHGVAKISLANLDFPNPPNYVFTSSDHSISIDEGSEGTNTITVDIVWAGMAVDGQRIKTIQGDGNLCEVEVDGEIGTITVSEAGIAEIIDQALEESGNNNSPIYDNGDGNFVPGYGPNDHWPNGIDKNKPFGPPYFIGGGDGGFYWGEGGVSQGGFDDNGQWQDDLGGGSGQGGTGQEGSENKGLNTRPTPMFDYNTIKGKNPFVYVSQEKQNVQRVPGDSSSGTTQKTCAIVEWKGFYSDGDSGELVQGIKTSGSWLESEVKNSDDKSYLEISSKSIEAVGPLTGEETESSDGDKVYRIKAGTYFDNKDGGGISGVSASSELANSCHIRGGEGIKITNGGSCEHGSTDGFIAQIDCDVDSLEVNFDTADFINSIQTDSLPFIYEITPQTEVFAYGAFSDSTSVVTDVTFDGSIPVISDINVVPTDVVYEVSFNSNKNFLTGLGTPPKSDCISASNLASKEVVVGSSETKKFLTGLAEANKKSFVTGFQKKEPESGGEPSVEHPTESVLWKLSNYGKEPFIKELGEPEKESFLTAATSTTPTNVITSIETEQKSVVTDVSLELSDSATSGSIAVVISIACENGDIIETVKYMKLNVTKENVTILKSYEEGTAVKTLDKDAKDAVTEMPETNVTEEAYTFFEEHYVDVLTGLADFDSDDAMTGFQGDHPEADAITELDSDPIYTFTSSPTTIQVVTDMPSENISESLNSALNVKSKSVVQSVTPTSGSFVNAINVQKKSVSYLTELKTKNAVSSINVLTDNALTAATGTTGKAAVSANIGVKNNENQSEI